jgi:hypothetical protein
LLLLKVSNLAPSATPSGFTSRQSTTAQLPANLYDRIGGASISAITINFPGSPTQTVNAELYEYIPDQNYTIAFDNAALVASGNTGTSLTTNGLTTAGTLDVLIAFFEETRAGATPATFSAPTGGFALVGSQNQQTDTLPSSLTTAAYDLFVTSAQNNVSMGITTSAGGPWNGLLLGYSETAPPPGPVVNGPGPTPVFQKVIPPVPAQIQGQITV